MANQIASFNMPTQYDLDRSKIERAQRTADMLMQQSQAPAEQFSYGGYTAPTSPITGVSKVIQGLLSQYQMGQADDKLEALGVKTRGEAGPLMNSLVEPNLPFIAAKNVSVPATDEERDDMLKGIAGGSGASPLAENATFEAPGGTGFGGSAALPARAKTTPERYADLLAAGQNPILAPYASAMFAQMMKKPESAFAKVAPEKFTPDSIRAFNAQGGSDYSLLVPVRKLEFITTIGSDGRPVQQAVDPFGVKSGDKFNQPLPGFMGQVQAAGGVDATGAFTPAGLKLVAQYLGKEVGDLTQKDLADLRLRTAVATNQGIETEFNTGRSAPIPPVPGAAAGVPGAAGGSAAPAAGPDPAKPVPIIQSPDISQKEKQQLLLKQPKETLSLRNVSQNIDQTVNEINALLKEPGFNSIFGSVVGRLPTYGTEGAIAETKYKNILDKLSVSAIQAMRDASANGGAVGAVSEKEWPILQNQFGTIGLLTTPDEARKNFQGIIERLMAVKDNTGAAYSSIYGNPGDATINPRVPTVNWSDLK